MKQDITAHILTCMVLAFFVSLLFVLTDARAQSPENSGAAEGLTVVPLGLGRNVPVDFWTKEHLFYVNGDTVRRTLEEHRGKMLVLDFWFSGCFNCLLHQKEIAYFKELYADELAVIMVNSKGTKEDYDKIVKFTDSKTFKNLGLIDFTSIIDDEYLEAMFVHYGFPHYVWINGRGVFQLQTFRNLLDRDYRTPFIDIKR